PGGPARTCPPRVRHPRAASPHRLLRLMGPDGNAAAARAEPLAVSSAQPCTLLDLAQGKCRWPLDERGASDNAVDFSFCGNEAVGGLSYCAGHVRMAYRLPARRRA
ncbi:MAG: GcrA family cell cycle regulator, partial [Xanthobacteraceae bacterium]